MDIKRFGDLVDMKARAYMEAHEGFDYRQAYHAILNAEPKLKEAYPDAPVTSVKSPQPTPTAPTVHGELGQKLIGWCAFGAIGRN